MSAMQNDPRPFLLLLAFGLLYLLFTPQAHALNPPVGAIQPAIDATNRVTVGVGAMNNSWGVTIGTNPGGTNIGKDFVMPGPGGRTAAAKVTAKLTAAELALFAGRAAGAIGAAAWVGSLVYDYWQGERVQPEGANGALGRDAGRDTVTDTVNVLCITGGSLSGQCFMTVEEAANAQRAAFQATVTGPTSCNWNGPKPYTVTYSVGATETSPVPRFRIDYTTANAQCTPITQQGNWQTLTPSTQQQQVCPAWVDFYGNSFAKGAVTPGPDGKCPTGTYAPITAEELQAIRQARANAWVPEDLNELTRELLGVVPLPVSDVNDVEVGNVVPGSLSGPETETTTTENGQQMTTTEAIGWDWSRDPLRKTEGNWIETKSTITRDQNGNTVRTSTTTTSGTTAEDEAKGAGDMCALNPDAAACKALGTAPEPDTIPEQEIEFDITPVSGFGPSTAACPAPRTISVSHGVQLSMPFDLLCEFADGIRPVVLAMAWIGAVFTFMGVSRREG